MTNHDDTSRAGQSVSRRTILKGATAAGAAAFAPPWLEFVLGSPAHAQSDRPLVIGVGSESDAIQVVAGQNAHLGSFVERSLLTYDHAGASFDIVPGTAAELPEILDDGLRYRFRLRDDAYYHDGTKMDAESIANWVTMQIDETHPQHGMYLWRSAGRLRAIERVEAVDELTVDFYLRQFNAAQMDWFTDKGYAGGPVEALRNGADLVNDDYAAGPYTVVDWQKGLSTVLQRFDKFYDQNEAPTRRIGLRPITEMNARIAALEAGEIDWMDGLTAEAAGHLRGVDGIEVKERKTLYVWFISLDMRKEPFNDLRVRQALNHALDKESLIRDILGGAAERSYSPLSPQFGDFYAGDQVQHYDYDPDKARALLAEAGYPNGFESTIFTNTGRSGQMKPVEMSQVVQANWSEVGVNCNIEALEWGAFERRRVAGEFAIATRGWTPSTADPDGVLFQNFHSTMVPPTQRNVCFLQDPEVDRLLDAGQATIDHAARVEAFVGAQKRIVDLAPWVFVCHEVAFVAHTDQVANYDRPHPSGFGQSLTFAYKK